MLTVMLQMAALVACGIAWRIIAPNNLDATTTRLALTNLVYYLFLPALVLLVLWKAPLGMESVKISVSACSGIIAVVIIMRLICLRCNMPPAISGAIILAAAFPNATYLGLPVLEASLGPEARNIAIQYDLFACTPLLLSLGIDLAARFGESHRKENPLLGLVKVPALWAATVAAILNANHIPLPAALEAWLHMLANGVVPMMLISLGLSLRFSRDQIPLIRPITPAIISKLAIMPLVVWGVAWALGLKGITFQGVVLEGAMPSMVIGMVICDRYKLDTSIYAATVTVSTALSFVTLSLWSGILGI